MSESESLRVIHGQETMRVGRRSNPLMLEYHDSEWGVPVHDDSQTFRVPWSGNGASWTDLVGLPN